MEGAFAQLRGLMLAEDWEAGAQKHEAEYQEYVKTQEASGAAVAPIGKWFVTQVMMNAMCTQIVPRAVAAAVDNDSGGTKPKRTKVKDPSAVAVEDDDDSL